MSKRLFTALIAIALAVGISVISTTAFAGGPLPKGTQLSILPGSGSAEGVPCSVGSCFSMVNGASIIWTDFGPGTDGGFILGQDQMPGPQKDNGASTVAGELTTAWLYFGNMGSNASSPFCATGEPTCVTTGASANQFWDRSCASQGECLNKTTLGSWHVAWNAIAIPMGSGLGCKANADNQSACRGVTTWTLSDNPAKVGSTYYLKHDWVVPDGDPSGFANVNYSVILRGVITEIPPLCLVNSTDLKCDDNDPCTVDKCDPATGACDYSEDLDVNDGNPCTYDICDSFGVIHLNLTDGSSCSDNNLCTINDACSSGTCVGTSKTCADPDACTPGLCNLATGACRSSSACTPPDVCDPAVGLCLGSSSGVNSSNNNFSMIDPAGGLVGGTNDIRFTWDGTTKTSVAVSGQESNATLSSPCPFFGSTWSAHDVAIYGPGTYTVYADCPAGSPGCGEGPPVTFTVGSDELGAHMLFNWTTSSNIDVVDIWTPNAAFGTSPMMTGVGGCGSGDASKVWDRMSKDWDGDGVNGKGMVDGPFANFNANFNVMLTENIAPPTKPVLVFPADKATGLPTTVEFRWKRSTDYDNDAITYSFTYCMDSALTSTITPTTCTTAPVTVASRNSKGMFYAGGAGLLLIGMTFIGGVKGKRMMLLLFITVVLLSGGALISCNNSNNGNLQGKYLDIGELSYTVSGLSSRTTYYWKVTASDGKSENGSNVSSFTTQ